MPLKASMEKLRPYFQLMRLDKPTGTLLLMLPCLWSLGIASGKSFDAYFLLLFFVFAFGAIIMRSAGCVINDIIDKDIDAKVERTKNRPLASGALNVKQAYGLLAILLTLALSLLLTLNALTIIIGCLAIIPAFIYPLMKRFTYWPQMFLGFTFNIGVIMAWVAYRNDFTFSALLIYAAAFFWTMGYDTIYAHQDKNDDKKAGIKSTALKFGDKTKAYVSAFYTATVFLLFIAGKISGFGIIYKLGIIAGLCQLYWQVNHVRLDNPENCRKIFVSNIWFGIIIFLSVYLDKILANYLAV